ncbi:MAG: hypothetical protein KF817_07495 [Phycisphaeraceae bacterium]|nr:hypothetical protein [Phycisphaeraceae bacterium]
MTACVIFIAWPRPGAAVSEEVDDTVGAWDGWMTLRADDDDDDASSRAAPGDDAVAEGQGTVPGNE